MKPLAVPLLLWAALGTSCAAADSAPTAPATAEPPLTNVKLAGVRSSNYGIRPFPSPEGWQKAMETMAGYFPGSKPMAIWIVGPLDGTAGGCRLEFPKPEEGRDYGPRITFAETDKHEPYLRLFDARGTRVFLQVEPGFADIGIVIDLVLARYKHHPSVVGFGVDVEWFENARTGGTNARATDALVEAWEKQVKSHDPKYRLFVKHYDRRDLSPTYRGDVLFVDDSQMFKSYGEFLAEFKEWADFFHPNPVVYQVGYRADKAWWSALGAPVPQTMGRDLCRQTRQDCGVAWVDFTLRDVLPSE